MKTYEWKWEGQVVLVNKRNTNTSPEVLATRIQDRRHMKMQSSVVVRLSAQRS